MFEQILICTDITDGLHRLSKFISCFKLAGVKKIVFLHVVPLWEKGIIPQVDTEKMAQAQSQLETAIEPGQTDIEVTIEVTSGKPVDTILKVAKAYQSQVIILGSQSRSILTEKLVGSTMAQLSHKTHIPLLVLRPQIISTYTSEELKLRCQHLFRSLLIPYDNSQASNYLVQQVKHLAKQQCDQYLQECLLCWVVENTGAKETPRKISPQQAHQRLSEIKAELEGVNLQVETQVREGNYLTEVLNMALMTDISAIAVSSGTIGKLQEWLVSSFAAQVLRQSCYPVMFFPWR